MMRKITVPWCDGTSNLQEIDQSYIHLAAELIDLVDGKRVDMPPSKGTISLAKNILFKDVLADAEVVVKNLSMGLGRQLSDILQLFGRQDLVCVAGDYRPSNSTPFASLFLQQGRNTASIWFSPVQPFVQVTMNAEVPKKKSMFQVDTQLEKKSTQKGREDAPPKIRFNLPQKRLEEERDHEGNVPKRQKTVSFKAPVVTKERTDFWENQLKHYDTDDAGSLRKTEREVPKKVPSLPTPKSVPSKSANADFWTQQLAATAARYGQ